MMPEEAIPLAVTAMEIIQSFIGDASFATSKNSPTSKSRGHAKKRSNPFIDLGEWLRLIDGIKAHFGQMPDDEAHDRNWL
jgi:hypothetical protein